MTVKFSGDDGTPVDLVAATEVMLREHAEEVVRSMEALRAGHTGEIKDARTVMRDMRLLFAALMDERTRVDKLRHQVAGVVHDRAFDFDAARDEIGRRLARLRDA